MLPDTCSNRWLIYRHGAIGDTVLLSSVVQIIRKEFPESWIELLGVEERLDLLVGEGLANKARSSESLGLESLYGEGDISPQVKSYLSDFDWILWYSSLEIEKLYPRLCMRENPRVYVFPSLPRENETGTHVIHHYIKALPPFMVTPDPPLPKIGLTNKDRDGMHTRLREMGIDYETDFLITMHTGAGSTKKAAPAEQFLKAVQFYSGHFQIRLFITQGPADKQIVSDFLNRLPIDINVYIFDNEPLRNIAALLELSDLYIGNDSGISHIAGAVGCPSLIFFISSNPDLWKPLGKGIQIIDFRKSG